MTGFTESPKDLAFDLESALTDLSMYVDARVAGSGSVTYHSQAGFAPSDIASNSDMSVDNLELDGIEQAPAIVSADLHAGLWDNAFFVHFLVNYEDLTMGALVLRAGTLGEVSIELDRFKATLRGLMQQYQRVIGELTGSTCRANLYDARCKVSAAGMAVDSGFNLTATGTIEAVGADGVTLYDSSRTEPGPLGGVAITGITNANPGVVTMADASLALTALEPVTISENVGMPLLNTVTLARDPSGTTFKLGIDTTDTSVYGTYVSWGMVTPLGNDSGFFDDGLITFTSGLNDGLSMEVKSYVPGQLVLYLPMPYAVAIGDTYTMLAGCDKTEPTCCAKFGNVANMRAEPWSGGDDKLVQVGKQ